MAGLAAVALPALAACAGSTDDDSAAADSVNDEAAAVEAPAATEEGGETAGDSRGSVTGIQPGGIDLGTIGRDVIVEMRVTMTSTDMRATVQGVMRAAGTAGGGVASSDVDYGEPSTDGEPMGHAVLVVKVPPDRVEDVLSSLDDVGTVTAVATDAQDVTQQLVDLDVQILNARRSVDRVRELLDQATDLRTVVEIEADLTQRQTRLEQLEATQLALSERVAYATLTVEVESVPIAPAEGATDDDGIRDAFAAGWDAFVGAMFAIGFVVAVLAPFLVTVAIIGLVAWLVTRRLQHRTTHDHGRGPDRGVSDADEERRASASHRS